MRTPTKIRRPFVRWMSAAAVLVIACISLAIFWQRDERREAKPSHASDLSEFTTPRQLHNESSVRQPQSLIGDAGLSVSPRSGEPNAPTRKTSAAPVAIHSANSTLADADRALNAFGSTPLAIVPDQWPVARMKFVIGPTATVLEPQSELEFQARVDTGARSCSLHVEDIFIEDEADVMDENIGREIRFKVMNHEGASHWIESIVDCCTNVRTSDNIERRYKVPIALRWNDLERIVLVTLNNRANMTYPVLLGRNFLGTDFVVDVALDRDW